MNDIVYSEHRIKCTYTTLSNVDSGERKGWLGERISSIQRRMEIPGVMERNGAKNINCVNNNMLCTRLYWPIVVTFLRINSTTEY